MTHLLHLDVEEGGGEENVSTILDRYTEANIESSDIISSDYLVRRGVYVTCPIFVNFVFSIEITN